MAEKKVFTLSPTSLNLFLECPCCFWLQINRRLRRPMGPFPSLPGGMDGVLKRYFDLFRQGGKLPALVKDKVPGKLISNLPKTLYYFDGEARLMGKLDECLELPGGLFVPLDHKTRGYPPKEIFPAYHLQMDAYALLLKENNYKIKNEAYLVYYYPLEVKEPYFNFGVEVKKLKTDPENAREVFKNALALLKQSKVPDPSHGCAFCGFVEQRS